MQDGKKTILLFDSLDAVSRDAKSMSLFRQFIQLLWSIENVQTVCSVRTYDNEYSPAISSVQWGTRVNVGGLSDRSLEEALLSIGNSTVPDELKKILHNPLRLKILQMIVFKNPSANFAYVKSEVRLYQEHWREYVEKSGQRDKINDALMDAAGLMIRSRSVAVMGHALADGRPSDRLDAACTSEILVRSGDRVRFFHHAYLDYVASKYVLQAHPDIVGFLEADPHNVFFLPTLAFALSLIHDGGNLQYLKAVASICKSNLPYYWKSAALKSLAGLDGFAKDEIDPLGRILSVDTDLQRHFLLEAARLANPFWLRIWADPRMKGWLERPHNAKVTLDYIRSLSDHRDLHEKMVGLARIIVENADLHPIVRQKAVMSTANMSAPSAAGWYVELSRHPDARVRNGVLHCLDALLDEDEDAAATAFANVASYRETSSERTRFAPIGSFNMYSTKMQDNSLAVWEAGEMFSQLLAKKPAAMIRAAMTALEPANAAHLPADTIVEDHTNTLIGSPVSSPHYKMLRSIEDALPGLLARDSDKYASLLGSSRLAAFHRILLSALAKQPDQHKDLIYNELSIPAILTLPSLREAARVAIRLASRLLPPPKIEALIGIIMALGTTNGDDLDQRRQAYLGRLKSYYLSAFDRSVLPAACLELADRHPSPPPHGPQPPAPTTVWSPVPTKGDDRKTPVTPEQAIALLLKDGGAERADSLDLLELSVGRAGDVSAALDAGLANQMRSLFLGLARDPDPRENDPDAGRGAPIISEPTVRGLAARGLIRLCARTQDRSLLPEIESLSWDGINTVRSAVAEDVGILYAADADLACKTAVRYSADADRRVLLHMPGALFLLARNHPADALSCIQSILSRREASEELADYISQALLFIALEKGLPRAWNVLWEVIDNVSIPAEIRRCMPFNLKEGYLFRPSTQDKSLDIFSKLLDSKEKKIREAASFFLLASIGDGGTENLLTLIEKIGPHLDKIALEIGAVPYNPEIIETLIGFLKDYWHLLPGRALDLLEGISRMQYASYEPVFMDGTVAALNGLFRTLPDEKDQNRCLAVLDSYVKAGWPDAMNLLRKMGRPD